jgi:NAD(P)-dependent dehydrogenase (short-subunit alcohol dehydrogenase family)
VTLAEFDLSGRVAFVTGAGRGIAGGIARVLAEAGADVALNALTPAYLEPLAAEIAQATGRRVQPFPADMTRSASVDATVSAVLEAFGRIDILVNGVGDAIPSPLVPRPGHARDAERASDENIERVMGLNLSSALLCMRAVAPAMLERRSGTIVNVGSFAGARGGAGMSLYAAAKSGLAGLTRALALEWAEYGVRVNAIAPGTFPDVITAGQEGYDRMVERARQQIPLGRPGELREAGLLALYLASEASSYMTGQTLTLDGGSGL